jgi:hypothetical protein
MESNELTVGISHDHSALRHRSILNGDGECEVKILMIGCAETFLELPRDDGGEGEPFLIATDEIEARSCRDDRDISICQFEFS